MVKRSVSGLFLVLLLVGILVLTFNTPLIKASGTIYIRADGSVEGTAYIQTADNVTYVFTADINNSIVIERNHIIVEGNGHLLKGLGGYYSRGIELAGRSNVTIRNIRIATFGFGIYLKNSSNISIFENDITNNDFVGVNLESTSHGNSISGNNITNDNVGIYLESSSHNSISENNIKNNSYGVDLEGSTNNSVSGNFFIDDGLFVEFSYGNAIVGNLVNGKPLVYLEGVSDAVVADAGQLILVNCTGIHAENLSLSHTTVGAELWKTSSTTITGNNITNNSSYGIRLFYASNNTLSGNNIYNNYRGIELWDSLNNSVSRNNITTNHNCGLELDYSSNCTVSGNNITANGQYGILLAYSSSNRFCHNNFVGNRQHVYNLNSTNSWDNDYPHGGNYWNNYLGKDLYNGQFQNITGSDERGDTPYLVDSNNRDRYPLMKPWIPFENQTIYIRADGHIDPSGAPLLRKENLYVLLCDTNSNYCSDGMVIEKSNVVLDGAGYTLQGSGNGCGFILSKVNNITIRNTNIKRYRSGILADSSFNDLFSGNNIIGNNDGITISSSSNNTIVGNNIENNGYGMLIYPNSNNNVVSRNSIKENLFGVKVYGSLNTLSENNVENNQNCGIGLLGSTNTVARNNITGNGINGILIFRVSRNIIIGNNVENNMAGIVFSGFLGSKNNNTVSGNDIKHNDYGIWLEYSASNMFYHNNLVDNEAQVHITSSFFNSVNFWNNSLREGNYWSDYIGIDSDHDGIGDSPYIINANNRDNYPLMSPFIPGDYNHDGAVNMTEVDMLSVAWQSRIGDFNYNPHVDCNMDGIINIKDFAMIGINWQKHI